MWSGNEDEVMKTSSTCCQRPLCFHTSSSVREKSSKPGTHVRPPYWFLIILVFLLAGRASCNHTSSATSPSPLPPTLTTTIGTTGSAETPTDATPRLSLNTTDEDHSGTTTAAASNGTLQTTASPNITKAAYYWVQVTVDVIGDKKNESDISALLRHLFQNHLERCTSRNDTAPKTTSSVPLLQTTSVSLSYAPTHNTTTLLHTFNATATPYNFTTAAETQNYSLTTSSGNFSTATTLYSGTETISPSENVTSSSSYSTTLEANDNVTTNSRARDATGEMDDDETSDINIFQGIEVSCWKKNAIRRTNCSILLKLSKPVHSCCILKTLCLRGRTSDIHVVGKRVQRVGRLHHGPDNMECNSSPKFPNICISTNTVNASCEESVKVYVPPEKNSTDCGISVEKRPSCNCSAYCNGTAAYYTFEISIQNPTMNFSYVSSLISRLKTPPPCSPKRNNSCPFPIIASEYKDAHVTCGSTTTNLNSCRVIVSFAQEVPVCAVSTALLDLFQIEKNITYDGRVTRAAICGNPGVGKNPLDSNFTWVALSLEPSEFCLGSDVVNILNCQKGSVCVLLTQQCHISPPSTTSSPNVTATTLNQTSVAATTVNQTVAATTVNQTSARATTLNQTSVPATTLNQTSVQQNTTSSTANVTSPPLNTTAAGSSAATTAAANVTVTAAPNTTVTTGHASTSNITSGTPTTESMTTAESLEGQANALLDLTRDVANLNSSEVDQLVSQLEDLLAGPTVSLALGNTSVHIVSNLLGASPDTLGNISNRIIGIVETVGQKLVIEKDAETILSQALALSVKTADGTNFQETSFSISDPNDVQIRAGPRARRSVREKSSVPQGSIRLPPSLTQDLTIEEQQQVSRVQFNFYQKSTVFQDRSLGDRRLISGILGASVANLSITGLEDDVVIHLRNTEPIPANFVASCVFWDFTRNDGSGGWNPDGCSVLNSTDHETVCGCNHLTSFAILLDLSRQPITSRLQANILTYITYIGCGISAIFLAITLLTYVSFGKLRKDIPSKILIQLCLALLLLNLVFLVDAWLALYPDAVGLCISTAWFLHYFLLASFTWMGLEAVHMYLALVKVFNSYISRYMLKFSLAGWGIPLVVVIIVIAIDKDNYGLVTYGKFTDGTTDDFCWLKNDIAFYVAVVAYFCAIFLFNFIMFIVVMVQLCRIKKQNPHNVQHRSTMQDVRSVVGITILLGLTWGFAFFAWGPVNLAFMYLFAIFNSLQGFFIFVFHCAVKDNVRRQWRTYLCCGKLRLAENSEWSRTATQKTVKKSSVIRASPVHSFRSSQSNNSSSSYLVSDSSEQSNGIGNPMEDRAITADEEPGSDVILNELNSRYRNRQAP